MNAYCDRQSVDLNSIAFLFDGRRLRAEQTPDEVILFSYYLSNPMLNSCIFSFFFNKSMYFYQLEMEDGDEIDAMLHQTGGSTR